MKSFLTHGRIMEGVVSTPNLDAALEDYHSRYNGVKQNEVHWDSVEVDGVIDPAVFKVP